MSSVLDAFFLSLSLSSSRISFWYSIVWLVGYWLLSLAKPNRSAVGGVELLYWYYSIQYYYAGTLPLRPPPASAGAAAVLLQSHTACRLHLPSPGS